MSEFEKRGKRHLEFLRSYLSACLSEMTTEQVTELCKELLRYPFIKKIVDTNTETRVENVSR